MNQVRQLPHSKLWYHSRDLVRTVTYAMENFVQAIPEKISEELKETREHFDILSNTLNDKFPSKRLRTGLSGMLIYDLIYTANRWGMDVGYRFTLKREAA
ncbi:MAG: hypothetical protein WCK90_01215 [archaeon]